MSDLRSKNVYLLVGNCFHLMDWFPILEYGGPYVDCQKSQNQKQKGRDDINCNLISDPTSITLLLVFLPFTCCINLKFMLSFIIYGYLKQSGSTCETR